MIKALQFSPIIIFLAFSILIFTVKREKTVKLTFSSPSSAYHISFKDKQGHILYSYDEKITHKGALYSADISKECSYIQAYDRKYDDFSSTTEFNIELSEQREGSMLVFLDSNRKLEYGISRIMLSTDKHIIDSVHQKLEHKRFMSNKELLTLTDFIMSGDMKEAKDKIHLHAGDEALLIFLPVPCELKWNKLVPFLYVKIEE